LASERTPLALETDPATSALARGQFPVHNGRESSGTSHTAVLKWLIDQIIPQKKIGLLLLAVGLIFLGYQGRTALTSVGNFLMLTAAQKMGLTLRVSLLRHLDTLSAEYYENTPVGSVMYPLKEPVEEVSYFGSDLLPAILRMLLTTSFTLATMSCSVQC